jgi:type I restriction-modification system DNA methylase subunit
VARNKESNRNQGRKVSNGSALDFEAQLWAAADKMRGHMDADIFRADLHPDLKADLVPVRKNLANPPFNMSDWGGENLRQDVRWKFGMPPVNNARIGE